MRSLLTGALLVATTLSLAGPARADERADALAVLNRAIQAHGGEVGLFKARNFSRNGVGTVLVMGMEEPFTEDLAAALPDKMRQSVELNARAKVTTVFNGEQGWQVSFGPARELGKDFRDELREELYIWWLTTLVPLKGDTFQLAPVPEITVSGEAAAGIKATSTGRPEAKLYFNKQTGLLVKIERRARHAGQMVSREYYYGDHKEFDGVKLYTRLTELINGRKNSELTGATYKILPRIDDSTFARP
jgi:hypothetical protein